MISRPTHDMCAHFRTRMHARRLGARPQKKKKNCFLMHAHTHTVTHTHVTHTEYAHPRILVFCHARIQCRMCLICLVFRPNTHTHTHTHTHCDTHTHTHTHTHTILTCGLSHHSLDSHSRATRGARKRRKNSHMFIHRAAFLQAQHLLCQGGCPQGRSSPSGF